MLDAGWKSIACDHGLPVPMTEGATTATNEEAHDRGVARSLPALGSTISLRPQHSRLTFNLHESAWLARARGDRMVDRLRITAGRRSV